mmetsp:Transcript_52238/g.146971  ORF Transcript_52238/g.146971 Transcript_52238/m.146971 type:complete len:236 (-) Transcript_52238:1145-1852(-)
MQPGDYPEAVLAHALARDYREHNRRRLECLPHLADLRVGGEDRLRRQRLAELACHDVVQEARRLSLDEGQLLAVDLLLVMPALVDLPVHGERHGDAQHDDRGQREVVHALHDDEDHSQGHLLEAAEHRRAPHHGVDPGGAVDEAELLAEAAHEAAEEAAEEHRRGEGAPRHGEAREADVEGVVDAEGDDASAVVDLAAVAAGEEDLHGAVRRVHEQGRDGVVVALRAVEPHVLQL